MTPIEEFMRLHKLYRSTSMLRDRFLFVLCRNIRAWGL